MAFYVLLQQTKHFPFSCMRFFRNMETTDNNSFLHDTFYFVVRAQLQVNRHKLGSNQYCCCCSTRIQAFVCEQARLFYTAKNRTTLSLFANKSLLYQQQY